MLRRTASPQLAKGGGNPDADALATQFKPNTRKNSSTH
jgi:hypothetical protein